MPSARSPDTLRVTVVVPTHDRPLALARCLSALAAQRGDIQPLEIVVADDASRDANAVANAARTTGARLVRLGPAGVSAARNAGAAAARGRFVCFTDDDCIPGPDWVKRLLTRLDAGAEAVAGPTLNGRSGDPLASAAQVVANAFVDRVRGTSAGAGFVPTSNLGCRLDLVTEIPFDETLSRVGAEDRDWYRRVLASGHRVEFEPTAIVLHHQELTLASFWHKHVRYGRGAYRFRRRHGDLRPEAPAFYAGLIRRGFGEGAGAGALVALAQVATAAGFAAQVLADRRA